MFQGLAEGFAVIAIIYTNFFIGLPFLGLLWIIGWRSRGEISDQKFRWARMLFSCSVLLNALWRPLLHVPSESRFNRLLEWFGPNALIAVLALAFLCLCVSIFAGYRSRGPGRPILFIGQVLLV